jgi:hypothetical protein
VETLPTTTAADPSPTPGWGPVARTVFRFACVYVLLYSWSAAYNALTTVASLVYYKVSPPDPAAPAPLPKVFEYARYPVQWFEEGVGWFTPRACRALLNLEVQPPERFTGSGDGQMQYARCFAFLVVAVSVGLLWTLASERRSSRDQRFKAAYSAPVMVIPSPGKQGRAAQHQRAVHPLHARQRMRRANCCPGRPPRPASSTAGAHERAAGAPHGARGHVHHAAGAERLDNVARSGRGADLRQPSGRNLQTRPHDQRQPHHLHPRAQAPQPRGTQRPCQLRVCVPNRPR